MNSYKYTVRDYIAALLVTVFVLLTGIPSLTTGVPEWGDDFAAYINEGIAIAEGDFHELTIKNYTMHPSTYSAEASDDGLVYVWGYPLFLAGIYKMVGFDRVDYSTVIYYKIPSLLALSLLGGVQVLFYRRRFPLAVSAALSLLLCFNGGLFEGLNGLYSDITFLFFGSLTLLLAELYPERTEDKKWPLFAALYGIVLWLTHEIRLNGMTICAVAILGHAIFIIKNRKKFGIRKIIGHVAPYAVFAVLTLVSEHLWLAPATSNMSDVGKASADIMAVNIIYYGEMICGYLGSLFGFKITVLGVVFVLFIILGIIFKGIRENLHLTVLLFGTLIVLVMLPYEQGIRYIYNILPLLLMFASYGLGELWKSVRNTYKNLPERQLRIAGIVLLVLMLVLPVFGQVKVAAHNISHKGEIESGNVYDAEAVDMYNYIQANLPEDCMIAFGKPRALYLNTNRMAFRTGFNGHRIYEADYYLEYLIPNGEFDWEEGEASITPMEMIYENESFRLYKVTAE